ncbi:MAG: hypothetical protein ACD_42C00305G0001 [uncultured bacterium]|nr:MAG: hypothetical protein ACD_42C00305G0001 [uncultured bacterium]OGT34334.1 MAG: hypothetical protein A3C44_07700 [Gammaproteobacteria bacterium RIFCSPHIGHO2_02_FULL_39_13]OGT48982.1 MAG: hypothetical protein A3E53_01680 [Gammaproteobacteria bacterium RIFCSPHIGHO2_12_FULL_39_24]
MPLPVQLNLQPGVAWLVGITLNNGTNSTNTSAPIPSDDTKEPKPRDLTRDGLLCITAITVSIFAIGCVGYKNRNVIAEKITGFYNRTFRQATPAEQQLLNANNANRDDNNSNASSTVVDFDDTTKRFPIVSTTATPTPTPPPSPR